MTDINAGQISVDEKKRYIMRQINTLTKVQKMDIVACIQKYHSLTEVAEGMAINMDHMRPDVTNTVYLLIQYYKSIPTY